MFYSRRCQFSSLFSQIRFMKFLQCLVWETALSPFNFCGCSPTFTLMLPSHSHYNGVNSGEGATTKNPMKTQQLSKTLLYDKSMCLLLDVQCNEGNSKTPPQQKLSKTKLKQQSHDMSHKVPMVKCLRAHTRIMTRQKENCISYRDNWLNELDLN